MRVLAVHADVIVAVSGVWRTTCTAVRSSEGGEGFLIDSPVLPDELAALPGVLQQSGFPVSGLLATHADWDHLLGRLAFPEASLGCAPSTAERLATELGAPQRDLRTFDEQHYVARERPLALSAVQELPVPGRLALGDVNELELHETPGHTSDGAAFWLPWAGVLVCGDYLSPVEIPMISDGGSLAGYASTLERLRHLVRRAETIVPGHGAPLQRDEALRVLDEDDAYLLALRSDGESAPLPAGRRTTTQRAIHRQNAERSLG